ncbi:MAG: sigma-70 family RNA polymerase sigma factor [Actinobacteria bacterium]|nr:sigma-70 family RNA polymerase sigma factor [Actinomycetota bacterium]
MAQGISDESLFGQYCAGATELLEVLINRYRQELYAFLARFLGDEILAQDVFQETFLQVHLSKHTFQQGRAFRPWLFAVAANKARDAMRVRSRKRTVSLDASPSGDQTDVAGSFVELIASDELAPVAKLSRAESASAVRRVIADMPDHLRQVLLLAYFQQLPYKDIAEIVDIPLGTVKSRLHSALARFATLWSKRASSSIGYDQPRSVELEGESE